MLYNTRNTCVILYIIQNKKYVCVLYDIRNMCVILYNTRNVCVCVMLYNKNMVLYYKMQQSILMLA